MPNKKKKIVVAMSGGLDSSMAAFLLQKQGYEIVGVFMRLERPETVAEGAARRICRRLGVKFYPVNLADKFKSCVVDYFLDTYRGGSTPNPCVRCNKLIKFGELDRVRRELGADYLATGHYARVEKPGDKYILKRGADKSKDQSYFLYNLNQELLEHVLFPLGDKKKEEVRAQADARGLPYIRSESQDVCFLVVDDKIIEHNEYLKKHLELKPGPIQDKKGKVLGEHKGLPLYTVGQRRGVEIGGTGPYYVLRADYRANALFVTNQFDDPDLFSDTLEAMNVNWVDPDCVKFPLKCQASIRYRHEAVDCAVEQSKDRILATFEKPQRAVTPGQSVVFYAGDVVLGGGIIM